MKKSNGFTLIEVTIASVILFSSLAIMSQIFNSSSLFSIKAQEHAHFYQSSSAAITAIKSDVRYLFRTLPQRDIYESELIVGGTVYEWKANKIQNVTYYHPNDDSVTSNNNFALYSVTVSPISEESLSFEFEVFLWL